LFRLPTFSGGAVAAFGISASIFSCLLYLVLYLQDVLGYSAYGTGLRLLVLSAGIMVTTPIAGRLSARVPVRYLIGPGLLLVGLGLVLMLGIGAGTHWTHLIAGLAIAGAGSGMVNPPLASTAVGVVKPERAGMASGINSTFRQVGIATGIALLGTLFANRVTAIVMIRSQHIPALRGHGAEIAGAITSGRLSSVQVGPGGREAVESLARTAFAAGLDRILLTAAIIAFVAGLVALVSIRQKDFVSPR
jgi:predicted MFS family arabinose efflux permease